ncbi:MAG: hypothetical protein LAP61_21200 [Acidobacteriia bacterium]|nr:hypothetical protein [Terriglobia bacterium]
MQSEDFLAAALRALAEQDSGREAPEAVEARLVQAFRRSRARKKLKTIALASLAAAAGLVVFLAAGSLERPKPAAPVPVVKQLVAETAAPVERAAAPAAKAAHKARPIPRQPREIVTQFFPLLDAAPPFERGELLRVTVPASTMRKVGLPVNEDRLTDRVYADVLVGQEGLARAIRFVSYEQ